MKRIIYALLAGALLSSGSAHSAPGDPFTSCPTKGFLAQSRHVDLYGVNLATGYYSILSDDLGTTGSINAIGFNEVDNYLYGWSYEHRQPVKIGQDLKLTPLVGFTNITDQNFFVGDVTVSSNKYYVYRKGANYGLYAIDLSTNVMTRVIDGDTLNLRIFDMAFNPSNNIAYTVDKGGDMYTIDVSNGSSSLIGNVGQSGTFGAMYFDPNNNLYISRNADGKIFRIDTTQASPTAELFAIGPSSSLNDGARCATASLGVEYTPTTDYGDAPDSYRTTLENNGARHDLSGGTVLHLGSSVDGETDAYYYTLSDDETDGQDDEDGVSFVTELEQGQDAVIVVNASSAGTLSAWIDWNQDGDFADIGEKIINDSSVNAGDNVYSISVPAVAVGGRTWARFRVSTTPGLDYFSGAGDGEVEDYQVNILSADETTIYYPGQNSWVTLAYEDSWPIQGDYDMNDLVVYYRTGVKKIGSSIVGIKIQGQVAAIGASYSNGFAINVPGLSASNVNEAGIVFRINDHVRSGSPLESGQTGAVFVVAENLWSHVASGENCDFYRTEAGCGSEIQMTFSMDIPLVSSVPESQIPASLFDPFMFASAGSYHGHVFDQAPGRNLEIHLKNATPTPLFNTSFLGLEDDASDTGTGQYFLTSNGMPWAMEIGTEWKYPREYIDIIFAYPKFKEYATSGGQSATDWYLPKYSYSPLLFVD